MNDFYTYELCSSKTPTTPFYIGKGKGNRIYEHEKHSIKGNHYNRYLQRKILKILNKKDFIVYRKICNNVSEEFAFETEKEMIAYCKYIGIKLCNLTDGGEGISGHKHSIESIQKIKDAAKNRPLPSKETKDKQSKIQKLLQSNPKMKEKLRTILLLHYKDHPVTIETRNKMKLSKLGINNPNYGTHKNNW